MANRGNAPAPVSLPEALPLDRELSRDEERFVVRALASVPPRYRVPLVLFYTEGRSVAKVAQILEISGGDVRRLVAHGSRLLFRRMTSLLESTLSGVHPESN